MDPADDPGSFPFEPEAGPADGPEAATSGPAHTAMDYVVALGVVAFAIVVVIMVEVGLSFADR